MNMFRRLAPYLRPQWRRITFGLVCMTLFAVLSGFSIGLILPIIDQVFLRSEPPQDPLDLKEGLQSAFRDAARAFEDAGSITSSVREYGDSLKEGLTKAMASADPMEVLAWLCAFTLIAVLLKNTADIGRRFAFIRVEQHTAEALRQDVFTHLLHLPLGTHKQYASGQFLSRIITDIELVRQFTVSTAVSFFQNLGLVIVFVVVCILASPKLSAISFLIVPLIAVITGKLASKLRKYSGRAQSHIADLTSAISESLSNIRIVKGFGVEDKEADRFEAKNNRYTKTVIKLFSLDNIAAPFSEFWGVTIGVGVMFYGGRLALDPGDPLTPGRFFAFLLALVSLLHPLKVLSNTITGFQRGAAAADRVFSALELSQEKDRPGAQPVHGLRRSLRFDHVHFQYEPQVPVLRGVTFEAKSGTTTALVGPSGGGKSTLVDLIPRFIDPAEGRIELDGVDLRGLKLADLRSLIGIVTQETILFNDTVYNNIAYGVTETTPEGVQEAARLANAHEFINGLSHGYDTEIGERGTRLSGGQRQRLAIARALLKNPPILILDEATSSLDAESETAVQEALNRLLENRTTFVIAHRLSTILDADQILFLEQGKIVEAGSHRELFAADGAYRRLYDMQFKNQSVS